MIVYYIQIQFWSSFVLMNVNYYFISIIITISYTLYKPWLHGDKAQGTNLFTYPSKLPH